MRSIEFRLTAWYAVLLFVGFVGLGSVLWLVVGRSIESAVDEALLDRVELLMASMQAEAEELEEELLEAEGAGVGSSELARFERLEIEEDLLEYTLALPESALTRIRASDGRDLLPLPGIVPMIPWGEGPIGPAPRTFSEAGASFRVIVRDVALLDREYTVLLAGSLEILRDVRKRVVESVVVLTPLALALCSLGGFAMAKRALQPVDALTTAAAQTTVGSLSLRIPTRGTEDSLDRLARTFNAMLERLEASVARLEQFAADASHELRTPISVIRTTAELALRHPRDERGYRDDLKNIRIEAERLSDLIEVLLSLARNGGQGSHVPMGDVNLSVLATDVSRSFAASAEQKELALEVQVPRDPVLVHGNDVSLRRLLGSLLDNALAHTESGAIRVVVEEAPEGARLRVCDTGEGIPEAALGRIFDRFYRVDPSRSRKSGGHGLGLSIAKRIAELHGAAVDVQSRRSEGTTFTVQFVRGAR